MKPVESSDATLEKDVQEKGITLVDFWAEWCGPCKMLGPVLEEIGDDRPELQILKVDVDSNPKLSEDYGIRSIPTVLVFKDRELVDRLVGAMSKMQMVTALSPYFE